MPSRRPIKKRKTRTRYGCNRQQARHLHHRSGPRPAGIPRQRILALGRDGQARGAHCEPARRQRRERARPRVLPGGTHAAIHHQHMHRAHGRQLLAHRRWRRHPDVRRNHGASRVGARVRRAENRRLRIPRHRGRINRGPQGDGQRIDQPEVRYRRLGRTRAVGGRLPALRHQERRIPGQSRLARAQRRRLLRFLVRRNRLARSAGTARRHVHRSGR